MCRLQDKDDKTMNSEASRGVREALEKCKRMARAAKAERPIRWHMNPNFKDLMPPREVADKLVECYLRTCEFTYRILHIPTFKRECVGYWDDPEGASTTLAVKMLLVMAIGTTFYQEEGNEDLRSIARQWIYSAQSWTAAPFEKSRLNIPGIQIDCLLLMARQTNAVGGELTWTASGTLLRTAFSMGLHRDPKLFPKLPIFVAEMRRRIWATVLELVLQTALEVGMPPLITTDDFDTEHPANIEDEDISEHTTTVPESKPLHLYTRMSIQVILLQSQRTRLKIVQALSSFQSAVSYDEVLRLGQAITGSCYDASQLMKSYSVSQRRPTACQSTLLDVLVRRYLIFIHLPFSARSKDDPRFYFSRKVCTETALTIFFSSAAEDKPSGHYPRMVDDYTRFKVVGGDIFKTVMVQAATLIFVELSMQLEEDSESGLPPSKLRKASREPMYQAVEDMISLSAERIRAGENNAKNHLFFSAAAAQIHAMTNGLPPEEAVPEAARRSALQCLELLRARTKSPPRTPVSDSESNPSHVV